MGGSHETKFLATVDPIIVFFATDKGERRSGMDRRQFSYHGHIPERRSGQDRRNGAQRTKNVHLDKKGLSIEPYRAES